MYSLSFTNTGSEGGRDELASLPSLSNPYASSATINNRRASSRLRQVLGNETSYEAIMKYMRLSNGKGGSKFGGTARNGGGGNDDDDAASDAGSMVSTMSATTRAHHIGINKLNASISTFTRRAQRELVPRIERLTNTNSTTIKLARELDRAMEKELKASCEWEAQAQRDQGTADDGERAFEIYLFKTLCGSIWKSEGRDAVLRYAIEAIDEIEGDEDDEFMDDEGVVEDPPLEEVGGEDGEKL